MSSSRKPTTTTRRGSSGAVGNVHSPADARDPYGDGTSLQNHGRRRRRRALPSTLESPAKRDRFEWQLREELRATKPGLFGPELERELDRLRAERTKTIAEAARQHQLRPLVLATADRHMRKGTKLVPQRSKVNVPAEIAAIMALPETQALMGSVLASARGDVDLRFPFSLLVYMAMGGKQPEGKAAYETLADPSLMWDLTFGGNLSPRTYGQVLRQLDGLVLVNDPAMVRVANMRLVRQLSEHFPQSTAKRWPVGVFPGTFAQVDGMLVPAFRSHREHEPEEDLPKSVTRNRRADNRARCKPVEYGKTHQLAGGGTVDEVHKKCIGYKLQLLADAALGVPLTWCLDSANGGEGIALRHTLVPDLFALWPEVPLYGVIGDALYGHSKEVSEVLLGKWGVHTLFPPPARSAASAGDDAANGEIGDDGVPRCGCKPNNAKGITNRMEFVKARNYPDMFWREKNQFRRGKTHDAKGARTVWRCRQARCPDEEVYWKQDPRLGTRFPHAGDSEAALLRRALMSQRNQIEAMFSSLQSLGLGADGVHACKWARDRGMEWLISLALYARTARVLVHVNGMYDRMLEAGGDVYAKGATPTDADRARVRELKADGQNVDLEGDLELLNPTREESDDMG